MERRFSKRIKMTDCKGVLYLPEEEVDVMVEDISRGGILFGTTAYGFCIADEFKFQFVDNDYNIISGKASLVRVRKQDKNIIIGCKCNGFDPRGYIDRLEIKDAMLGLGRTPSMA